MAAIAAAIDGLDEFSATATAGGDGVVNGSTADRRAIATTGIERVFDFRLLARDQRCSRPGVCSFGIDYICLGPTIDIKSSTVERDREQCDHQLCCR